LFLTSAYAIDDLSRLKPTIGGQEVDGQPTQGAMLNFR
jgi:hypothetical protein